MRDKKRFDSDLLSSKAQLGVGLFSQIVNRVLGYEAVGARAINQILLVRLFELHQVSSIQLDWGARIASRLCTSLPLCHTVSLSPCMPHTTVKHPEDDVASSNAREASVRKSLSNHQLAPGFGVNRENQSPRILCSLFIDYRASLCS